jgi:putative DNA methylase
MREQAEQRIGHLYPKVEITAEMAKERPDLKPLVGQQLTVIAWLWARTVRSPNPAYAMRSAAGLNLLLSTKAGKEAWVEPVVEGRGYHFEVRVTDASTSHQRAPRAAQTFGKAHSDA